MTTLAVHGEGTWTVNPVTGAISFTPEAGYLGDPTPVTYRVVTLDRLSTVTNTVTVTYQAPATLAFTGGSSLLLLAAGAALLAAGAAFALWGNGLRRRNVMR